MEKAIALIVSLMLWIAFTVGCKQAETPKPETPKTAEAPAPEPPGSPVEAPASAPPEEQAAPPDLVVVPSGSTYVYMVPDMMGLYFYHGYWYRIHEGRWSRATLYKGPWTFIQISRVPWVIVNVPPDYFRRLPAGYHRIHYRDLYSHWRSWDRSRHWHRYDWYKHGHERWRHDHRDGRDRKHDGRGGKQYDKGSRHREGMKTHPDDRRGMKGVQ